MNSTTSSGFPAPFANANILVQSAEPVCIPLARDLQTLEADEPQPANAAEPPSNLADSPSVPSNQATSSSVAVTAASQVVHEHRSAAQSAAAAVASATPPMPKVPACRVWGIDFASITMQQTLDRIDALIYRRQPSYIITANLNYVMLCEQHETLPAATRQADMVLCDGMPILWRSKLDDQVLPERVAGSDLIYRLSERAAVRGHRVYFLGAAEGVAAQAAQKLQTLFPGLQVAGVDCPPFRNWSDADRQAIVDKIKAARADVLLVAFGQPKGEFWIHENYLQLGVPVSIQLGASFDFVAGTAKRAPRFFQMTGLEWLYRALSQPTRLIPRYWKNFVFLMRTLRNEIAAS
jgi:N-acetylglucosaminyldiphosphoundecaprenol N-acetyl-beta-D-mannosaminyltransferase